LKCFSYFLKKQKGGKVIEGGNLIQQKNEYSGGFFVQPTIVEIRHDADIVKEELFVPVLYLIKCKVKMRLTFVNSFSFNKNQTKEL
jgi:acyl-CoA reductase-like NAD-dependent aldehyde dehydrogenase